MSPQPKALENFPKKSALSIMQVLQIATTRLSAAGVESPRRESRLLLGYATNLSPEDLIRDPQRMLGQDDVSRFAAATRRRENREPFARIVGHREFWGLDFQVNAATLIPRPDSETVVAAALSLMPKSKTEKYILDLGTGTGCLLLSVLHERSQAIPTVTGILLLSVLHERSQATGLGIDISEQALSAAQANAESLGLSVRARFQKHNFMQPGWAGRLGVKADLVLCNPPYIATADIPGLDPEVRHGDPMQALDGGRDGLACYESILQELPVILADGGRAIFEVGQGQPVAVTRLAESCNLKVYQEGCDLSGHKRVLAVGL